jgi:hypothetical protein
MLEAGIPIAAVEQRAQLEGLDMSVVLGTDVVEAETTRQNSKIPPRFLEKYQRMLKKRVPLKAVQCQAFVDGQWSPEDLLQALDVDVLAEIRGVPEFYQPRTWDIMATRKRPRSEDAPAAFTIQENGEIVIVSESPLAALIRKLIPAASKREKTIVVTPLTLYHALGSLQGIQVARDDYNSTLSQRTKSSPSERQWKRQAFAEMAKTINLVLEEPEEESPQPVDVLGLDLLVSHVQDVFRSELQEKHDLIVGGWYDFDSLGVLYPPGSRVIAKNVGGGGVDMMCRVAWNKYEQGSTLGGKTKSFQVCLHYMVAVGPGRVACAEVVQRLEAFQDRRQISSHLTFVPLTSFSKEQQEHLHDEYRRRGALYNRIVLNGSYSYVAYDKGSFFIKRAGGPLSSSTQSVSSALATGGRIIIDTQGAYDHGHSLGTGYEPMVMGIKYKYKEYQLHMRASRNKEPKPESNGNTNSVIALEQVPDDYLEMVWPLAIGFSLTARGWGDVLVDSLQDIPWQHDIFDRLVLPETRKSMIKALVRNCGSDSFQDLVQGKGGGTVFLLYGEPGCGKTLTAEAVAEHLQKPLYSLSLGTLGTTAADLELRLGEIMTLAAHWDALILLDEADSFLETRSSTSSLERNAMVSVMLRLVEYFSGILFLTSNRIESLDPAFQTRITLALRYDPLDAPARAKVWKNLFVKSGLEQLLEDGKIQLNKLSEAPLNGREIKNALRLGMAMAAEQKEPLSQQILLETVHVVTDYKASIHDPYRANDDEEDDCHTGCFSWIRSLKH